MSARPISTTQLGLTFVRDHGVVLLAARGAVPSLAEAIAGEPIRGSWWGHAKSHTIFEIINGIVDSGEVLVCKLVDGKVTYVHRRLWPALVKLAARFPKAALAHTSSEHTKSGAHVARTIPFPEWVPREVIEEAKALPAAEAERLLAPVLAGAKQRRPPRKA